MVERSGNKAADTSLLLTVEECAARLRTGTKRVYSMCRGGELPHFRLGRRLYIPVSDLERYVSERTVLPRPDVTGNQPRGH